MMANMISSIDELLGFGWVCYHNQRFPEAIATFLAASEMASSDKQLEASARRGLSVCHSRMGDWDAALRAASRWVELTPDEHEAAAQLAQCMIDNKQIYQARTYLLQTVTSFASSFLHPEIAAMLEFLAGDVFLGITLVEEAIRRGMPYRPHVIEAAVLSCCLAGRTDQARLFLKGYPDEAAPAIWNLVFQTEAICKAGSAASPAMMRCPIGLVRIELEAAVRDRNLGYAGFLARVMFGHRDSRAEDFLYLSSVSLDIADAGDFLLREMISRAAAKSFIADPENVEARFCWIGHLVQKHCFVDAGILLRTLFHGSTDMVHADETFRLSVLMYRCGALAASDIQDALDRLSPHFRDRSLVDVGSNVLLKASPAANKNQLEKDCLFHNAKRHYRTDPRRRPKIAVCISGQLRSLRQTWPTSAAALSGLETELFVAIWSRTSVGIGSQPHIDRVVSPDIASRLPDKMRTTAFVKDRYPGLWSLMSHEQDVDENSLRAIISTANVKILDEDAFDRDFSGQPGLNLNGNLNQAKMYFAINQVFGMKSLYELQNSTIFDAVIRVRPDRKLERLGETDLEAVFNGRTLRTDHFYHWAVGDQAAVSCSSVADDVAAIWPRIVRAQSFQAYPGASGRGAEWTMGEWLALHDVKLQRLRQTQLSDLISTQLDPDHILAAILGDIAIRNGPDDLDKTFVSAFQDA